MNILFITSNRIGDAVLSTGLLGHLIERHPDAKVTVACGAAPAALFVETPRITRILPLVKRRWALHWLSLWLATMGTYWDLIVDLRGSAIGHFLLHRQLLMLPRAAATEHQVIRLSRALKLAEPASPRLWPGAARQAEARRILPEGGPILALGPTANWGGKQWPAERFAELARRLTVPGGMLPGARIAVFGAAAERSAALPLLQALPSGRLIDLIGHGDLLTACACLERATLYIGNDSGLMHMAAAAGIPTLGLFGPSREEIYGPWGANAAAVRTPETFAEIIGKAGYDYRRSDSHMSSLTVDAVVNAAERLWRRVKEAA